MTNPNLSSRQFEFLQAQPRSMGGDQSHTLRAKDNGETIGAIRWLHKTGEVRSIETYPGHRREGIATDLWHEAHRVAGETRGVKPPKHSPERTDSGEAWARSLGGRLPRRM